MDILEINSFRHLNLERTINKEDEGYCEQDLFFWSEGAKEADFTIFAKYENVFEYDSISDQYRYYETEFHSINLLNSEGDEITLDEEAEQELTKIILEKS